MIIFAQIVEHSPVAMLLAEISSSRQVTIDPLPVPSFKMLNIFGYYTNQVTQLPYPQTLSECRNTATTLM